VEDFIKMSQLVHEAGMGDKESMGQLVKITQPTLFSCLYRLTMDYHLAEDLLQQVQTEMVMSLWRLRKPDRFWPWIYKQAWGIVQQHYREQRKRPEVSISDVEQSFIDEQLKTRKVQDDAFYENIDRKKLFETVYDAMKKISVKQRTVLTMRCYNDLSFQEIGELLDCSETNARVMFFRAKNRIKSKLRHKGYRANKMFLPALGLFGTITSKSASATTPAIVMVPETSINVGFAAAAIGTLTSKLGLFCMSILTSIVAWFSIVNALLIGMILLMCLPLLIVSVLYMVYFE